MNYLTKIITGTVATIEQQCNDYAKELDAKKHRIMSMKPYFKDDKIIVWIIVNPKPSPYWAKGQDES